MGVIKRDHSIVRLNTPGESPVMQFDFVGLIADREYLPTEDVEQGSAAFLVTVDQATMKTTASMILIFFEDIGWVEIDQ